MKKLLPKISYQLSAFSFKKLSSLILLLIAYCLLLIFPIGNAHAQLSSVGIASYLPVEGESVKDGAIIISSNDGYFLANKPYDPQVVGVVTKNPAISLKTSGQEGTPVVNVGTVYVRVSGINGQIKKDDFITTSEIPGSGMKADRSGFVLGQALSDSQSKTEKDSDLVLVTLNLHFQQVGSSTSNSFKNILNLTAIASYEDPSTVLRYVVATVIIISSFVVGFLIFAKAVNTGIEALGRNPLAGHMIQLSIVFNVFLIIIVIIVGIGLAYIVLRL